MRVSGLLGSDRLLIKSLDDNKLRFITFNMSDKNDKQYSIEIEVQHKHFENSYEFQLDNLNLIESPDYKVSLCAQKGEKTGILGRGVLKIEAYLSDNIIMKYLVIGTK